MSEDEDINFDASASRCECPGWTRGNRDRILNVKYKRYDSTKQLGYQYVSRANMIINSPNIAAGNYTPAKQSWPGNFRDIDGLFITLPKLTRRIHLPWNHLLNCV